MKQISSAYTLRTFRNSRDRDYAAALQIYSTGIGPDGRTDSNDITLWLDRTYGEFGDRFTVFGFYADEKLVGFAQLAFFRQQKLLFFDYLVLHEHYRRDAEYFQFAKLLQRRVDDERLEFDYAAAEVSFESAGSKASKHSRKLARLFMRTGFRVVQCEYYQPPLGLNRPQSDIRAHLLVLSREPLPTLNRQTLLHIVRTIYFCHYERWYTAILLADIAGYKRILDERFKEFEMRLAKLDRIGVNGIESDPIPPPPPRDDGANPLVAPFLVICGFAFFYGGVFYLQYRAQLPWQTVALLFAGTTIMFATAFALFDKNKQRTLDSLLEALTKFFGMRK